MQVPFDQLYRYEVMVFTAVVEQQSVSLSRFELENKRNGIDNGFEKDEPEDRVSPPTWK